MKVNLKKAAALAAALSAASVRFDHSYKVDVYANLPTEEQIKLAHEKLDAQLKAALSLSDAVFTIRSLIGAANVGRINELLTARAMVEKKLSVLNSVPVRQAGTNLEALGRQVAAVLEKENRYGGIVPDIQLETASLITPLQSELKKSKRSIDDELQSRNFTTIIELPKGVVELLTELELV